MKNISLFMQHVEETQGDVDRHPKTKNEGSHPTVYYDL